MKGKTKWRKLTAALIATVMLVATVQAAIFANTIITTIEVTDLDAPKANCYPDTEVTVVAKTSDGTIVDAVEDYRVLVGFECFDKNTGEYWGGGDLAWKGDDGDEAYYKLDDECFCDFDVDGDGVDEDITYTLYYQVRVKFKQGYNASDDESFLFTINGQKMDLISDNWGENRTDIQYGSLEYEEAEKILDNMLIGGTAHVQDIGNKQATIDSSTGALSLGTTGQSKRLESILIDFDNTSFYSGALEYRVHVQNIGWMPWTGAGNPAGTSGKALRLEGIEMRLTGELAKHYSVEYCAHIQDYGDAQGWVRDGALAGTTGESKRIEQIKVRIVPIDSDNTTSVNYRVHVQDYGWESKWAANGAMSGTTGQSKRLEGIEIHLGGCQYSGGIRYKTHVQNIGWENTWTQDGEMSGTQGQSLRLEAIKIELYGEMASHYDVYYRVHAQDIGWMSWASNGASAGTAGRSARLEGIQIVLVPKGAAAPGATYQGITAVDSRAFIEGF